ncbi:hypothetical protein LIER_43115 [Lithospermum erythrorhizon]|uniref:Uncharacterized protein n=1 Tax=Lithospermum erythrorhizon TaxID=34254 RepID=A0AAV3PGD7_LITER
MCLPEEEDQVFEPVMDPLATEGPLLLGGDLYEFLKAAKSFVEPNKVPFSIMIEKRVSLFKRVNVVTKTSKNTSLVSTSAPSSLPSHAADVAPSVFGKWPLAPVKPRFGPMKC